MRNCDEISKTHINENEVVTALQKMKNGKAPTSTEL